MTGRSERPVRRRSAKQESGKHDKNRIWVPMTGDRGVLYESERL